MDRLTKLNGIGECELQACFDCGAGADPDETVGIGFVPHWATCPAADSFRKRKGVT